MRGVSRLWPREHGAYVECLAPLATGLMVSPSWSGAVCGLAVIALFGASEPVRILLGRRGARAAAELRSRALAHVGALGTVALVAASIWFRVAGPAAWAAAAPTAVLGTSTGLAIARRVDKTLLGELLIATTLASALVPVGIGGDMAPASLAWGAGAWAIVFALQTLTVHAVKSRRRTSWSSLAGLVLVGTVLGAAVFWRSPRGYPLTCVAVLVAGVLSAGIVSWTPHPRRLRQVGWSFALLDILVLTLIVWDLAFVSR